MHSIGSVHRLCTCVEQQEETIRASISSFFDILHIIYRTKLSVRQNSKMAKDQTYDQYR